MNKLQHRRVDDLIEKRSAWHYHWFMYIMLVLLGLSIALGGYMFYTISSSLSVRHQQLISSKSSVEIYNAYDKDKRSIEAKSYIDYVLAKYELKNGLDLKNKDQPIPQSVLTKGNESIKLINALYASEYKEKWSLFQKMSQVQNNYVALWQDNKVNQVFAVNIGPAQVYQFNLKNADTLSAIQSADTNNQFVVRMTDQMKSIAYDAVSVERLLDRLDNYYTMPTKTTPFLINHDYNQGLRDGLQYDYSNLKYQWTIISYIKNVLAFSDDAIAKNDDMRHQYNNAVAQIEEIKRQASIASSQKAESQRISSSISASIAESKQSSSESESRSKASEASSSSSQKDDQDASSSSSQSSVSKQDTSFIGLTIQQAKETAIKNKLAVTVITTSNRYETQDPVEGTVVHQDEMPDGKIKIYLYQK